MKSTSSSSSSSSSTSSSSSAAATTTTISKSSISTSIFSELSLFILFSTISIIGLTLNHIDDTDEVYGYYEPLHYLLYGKGMQTWEYSPKYAIRTYAYILPFVTLCNIVNRIYNFDKITMFYIVRFFISIFSSYGKTKFVYSIKNTCGIGIMKILIIFLLFSPGIFYSSTAYLPSASGMILIMISYSEFLNNNFNKSILWGSIAVLCLGWPFIAILFLPIGIYMIVIKYNSNNGINNVFLLIINGILIVLLVALPSILIDIYYYKKLTFPSLNILLYNSLGNSGDELYGIESINYYISNLILNLGILWPIACSTPIVIIRTILNTKSNNNIKESNRNKVVIMLLIPTIIWLLLLFNRPHKEERFMYPIYPLIAFLASFSIMSTCDIIGKMIESLFNESSTLSIYDLLDEDNNNDNNNDKKHNNNNNNNNKITTRIKFSFIGITIIVFVFMSLSRITSNNINYGGYINLWKNISKIIKNEHYNKKLNICTGGEWYQFPSHFFLPNNANLEFIYDNFHGQLPQYFLQYEGTYIEPLQPFNDKNMEEKSRYIEVDQCDYIIASIPDYTTYEIDKLIDSFRNVEKLILKESKIWLQVSNQLIIDPIKSTSSFSRAFYLPGISNIKNKYKKYSIYKKDNENNNKSSY